MANQPKTCKEWFEEADRHYAVQRIMKATPAMSEPCDTCGQWANATEALAELQFAVHVFVKSNSTLTMAGRQYSKPSIAALAAALDASRVASTSARKTEA